MIRSLWTAASGMQAQTTNIDVISNNLANVNTAGFKRSRAEFQDLLYETMRPAGTATPGGGQVPTGIQIGHGTRAVATQKMFIQGDFQHTENQLDMAIEGQGFFQITQANGDIAYTRAGNFKIDSEGRMVSPDGLLLEPAITIPTDALSVSISTSGTVSVLQPACEHGDHGTDGFGFGQESEGDPGDNSQRAFRTHHEPGQVIAHHALDGLNTGSDDLAGSDYRFKSQDIIPGNPVFHSSWAAGAFGQIATQG